MKKAIAIISTAAVSIILLILWGIIADFIFKGFDESFMSYIFVCIVSVIVGMLIGKYISCPFYEWMIKKLK